MMTEGPVGKARDTGAGLALLAAAAATTIMILTAPRTHAERAFVDVAAERSALAEADVSAKRQSRREDPVTGVSSSSSR